MATLQEIAQFVDVKCALETPDNKCPIAQSNEGKNCTIVFECFKIRKEQPEVLLVDFVKNIQEQGKHCR